MGPPRDLLPLTVFVRLAFTNTTSLVSLPLVGVWARSVSLRLSTQPRELTTPGFAPHFLSSVTVWPRPTVTCRVSSTFFVSGFSHVKVHCSVFPAFSASGRVDGVTIQLNFPLGGTTVV